MSFLHKITHHPRFIKLVHWEYWSFNTFYAVMYLYWMWLSLRAKSFFFFNAANPSITNGGFLMESKFDVYQLIQQQYYPTTLLIKKNTPFQNVLTELNNSDIEYPLIAKPDIGMRGMLVHKVLHESDLKDYYEQVPIDFLLQAFIPYQQEVGIFYYRMPNQAKGNISGIVGKEMLAVVGNGMDTIETLLSKEKRYILQLPLLRQTHEEILQKILPQGETYTLVPYGNHARGAKFIDLSHLIDEALTETIDAVCLQINGFYYGRLDIRYDNWTDLKQGKNFQIVEVNGAGSDPTHMYDPQHSLFWAWGEVIRHWEILLQISRYNHTHMNIPYMTTKEGLAMFKASNQQVAILQSVQLVCKEA